MIVSPTTAPSLTTAQAILADAPQLHYSLYARSSGSRQVTVTFVPALALNEERGRRYAVAIDDETPTLVALSSESGTGSTWSRSVLRAEIEGSSTHTLSAAGVHTLKIWMVDPGLILDRIVIDGAGAVTTYNGPRETSARALPTLRVEAGETLVIAQGDLARYARIVNDGTLEIRSSDVAVEGDLVNFGTLRIIGSSTLDLVGNLANFGLLDTLSWASP